MQNQNEIAKIAYELYLMRGGAPGDPVADWITAERIYAERMAHQHALRVVEETAQEVEIVVVEEKKPAAAGKPRTARKTTAKPVAKAATAPKTEKKVEPAKVRKVIRKKTNGAASE
jgi:hypothetical protein